jgi:hypothetical protein
MFGQMSNRTQVYIVGQSIIFLNTLGEYLVHFLGKEMDSKMVTITAPVNSLGGLFDSCCLARWESTRGTDLTKHYSSRMRKGERLCHDLTEKNTLGETKNLSTYVPIGVARWHIFKPKIPIWVNFGGSCNGRCWYMYFIAIWSILWHFGLFNGHLVYIFSPVLVCCTKKNLTTLLCMSMYVCPPL